MPTDATSFMNYVVLDGSHARERAAADLGHRDQGGEHGRHHGTAGAARRIARFVRHVARSCRNDSTSMPLCRGKARTQLAWAGQRRPREWPNDQLHPQPLPIARRMKTNVAAMRPGPAGQGERGPIGSGRMRRREVVRGEQQLRELPARTPPLAATFSEAMEIPRRRWSEKAATVSNAMPTISTRRCMAWPAALLGPLVGSLR